MGLFLLVFTTLIATALNGSKEIRYDRNVRPILSDRCFHCHGPDKHDRKAELRLDQTSGPDGAYRILDEIQAIKPGDLEESEVWHRIISDDEDELMPPPDSHKKKLTKDEVNIIRQWIENGADVRDLDATMLHQLGINHQELTYPFQGLDQKLTGVEPARVVHDLLI